MRPKELCFLVAFHTTTEALALEEAARSADVPGRLIPIPTQITAGCGLAWRMPIGEKEKMKSLLIKCDLKYENIYELMI